VHIWYIICISNFASVTGLGIHLLQIHPLKTYVLWSSHIESQKLFVFVFNEIFETIQTAPIKVADPKRVYILCHALIFCAIWPFGGSEIIVFAPKINFPRKLEVSEAIRENEQKLPHYYVFTYAAINCE